MSPAKIGSARKFAPSDRYSVTETPSPASSLDWTKVVSVVSVPPREPEIETALAPVSETPAPGFRFPNVGSTFLDFHIAAELGSGAFARVYLVRQGSIADRTMVLKLSTRRTTEPHHLGKLHHTNIVPIYSVHEVEPFQAVCMPYLGSRTLADILRQYRTTGLFPATVATTGENGSQAVVELPPLGAAAVGSLPPAVSFADDEQIRHVLKLGRDLADGLQHAHERGILHLDVKPANILLTDDGRAMLLDFNLSLDRTVGPRRRAGGTLPYMAPEQLEAYADKSGDRLLDERTDLYAVGIVLYELLTGTHPFPIPESGNDLAFYAASRRAGAAEMPNLRGSIPASVRSIVAKLLHSDPLCRYRSAADLAEDLQRELDDRPLCHAANVSKGEVVAKWCRRNTKLAVRSVVAAALIGTTSLVWGILHERNARAAIAAGARADQLDDDLTTLRLDLTTTWDDDARKRGLDRAQERLAGYDWSANSPTAAPDLAGLSAERATAVRERLGETAFLIVHARLLPHRGRTDDEARRAFEATLPYLQAAAAWNPHGMANALHDRGADFDRLRIHTDIETAPTEQPAALDRFLQGIRAITAHEYGDAVTHFTEVCERDPKHFAANYLLASALEERGSDERASERLSVARALQPQDARTYLRRGAMLLKRLNFSDAETEFTKAIACVDAPTEAFKLRGVARMRLQRPRDAAADFTRCIEAGHHLGQSYRQRAEAYDKANDSTRAAADRAAAARFVPTTDYDFLVRASLTTETHPKAALADLREATRLNPNSWTAWNNIGYIHAEILHDHRAALAAYDRAIQAAPESIVTVLKRGLLRARMGLRAEAHADAETVLAGKPSSDQLFSVACLYALTGTKEPKDEDEAVAVLRRAVGAGYRNGERLQNDPDLAAIRPRQVFRELLIAVYTLRME